MEHQPVLPCPICKKSDDLVQAIRERERASARLQEAREAVGRLQTAMEDMEAAEDAYSRADARLAALTGTHEQGAL